VPGDVGWDDSERVADMAVEEDWPEAERDGEERQRAGYDDEQLSGEQLRGEAAPEQRRSHSPLPIR